MLADDCLMFCGATKKAARIIRDLLGLYCTVSGQPVNCHIYKVQFSKGIKKAVRNKDVLQKHWHLFKLLNCRLEENHGRF